MKEPALTLFPSSIPEKSSVQLSGSKSFTNRALSLAALADGESLLLNPSRSEDSMTLMRLLKIFGVETSWKEEGSLLVYGSSFHIPVHEVLDVGLAGTVMRFITAYAAVCEGASVTISGTERMHERPIGPLVDALRTLGADIEYLEKEGCPPLQVEGKALAGGAVEIDGGISSQFLTALLLVGAKLKNGIELIPRGKLVSHSYLRMTCQTLNCFGVNVEEQGHGGFRVFPGKVQPAKYLVEGDASGASYLWGLAAIAGKEISVGPFSKDSLQGDAKFPDLLEQMGCSVSRDTANSSVSVTGPHNGQERGRLKAIQVDMENMPDTAQTLAVLAAVADGTSVITGLKTLRIKETDRILALQQELKKVGVRTEATEDSITIYGAPASSLKRAAIDTYEDHRMAMSFALLGAVIPGMVIRNPMVVMKSFPDFWERLRSLGFDSS